MASRDQLLNDSEEAFRLAFDGRQAQMWTAMPGIIESVDLAKMICSVQLSIQGTIENEQGQISTVNYPLLTHVPLVFPNGGGFVLTFPIAQGDECLIVFASRCIDAWWQSGGNTNRPMEARMHDLSDGFCIPGPRSQPNVVSSINATDVQLRNEAGTSLIGIKANGNIEITGPTVTVTGNLVVSGTVVAGTPPISLTTHTHSGVTSGSDPSGPPIP